MRIRLSELKKIVAAEYRRSLREGPGRQYGQAERDFERESPHASRAMGYRAAQTRTRGRPYRAQHPLAGYDVNYWYDADLGEETNTYDYVNGFDDENWKYFQDVFGSGIHAIVKGIDQEAARTKRTPVEVMDEITEEMWSKG